MKSISKWASRNAKLGIVLIILFEVIRLSIGLILGISLPLIPKIGLELTILSISFILLLVWKYHEIYQNVAQNSYKFRLIGLSIFFLGSFILSILLGNSLQKSSFSKVFAASEVKHEVKAISLDSLKSIQQEEFNSNSKKLRKSQFFNQKINERPSSSKIAGFIGLFLLSLILTYFLIFAACSLACGGYGVLAILVFLISVGTFSGGFYFLGRAFTKKYKPYKQMDKVERKREWKKWGIVYAIVTALIATLLFLE